MSAESDVYDALVADSTYNALVNGRVYAGHVPGNAAYPNADIALISETLAASNGMHVYRIQISNRATTYAATRQMRDAIINIVDSNGSWHVLNYGPDIVSDDEAAIVYMLPVDLLIYKGV